MMKYKEQVLGQLEDLKCYVDICIRSFDAINAINRAIKKNVELFGEIGEAIPHLEKAREATLLAIKRDVAWHKRMAKDIEDLVKLEEEKVEQ